MSWTPYLSEALPLVLGFVSPPQLVQRRVAGLLIEAIAICTLLPEAQFLPLFELTRAFPSPSYEYHRQHAWLVCRRLRAGFHVGGCNRNCTQG